MGYFTISAHRFTHVLLPLLLLFFAFLPCKYRDKIAGTPLCGSDSKPPVWVGCNGLGWVGLGAPQDMSVRTRMLSRMAQQLNEVAQKHSLAVRASGYHTAV